MLAHTDSQVYLEVLPQNCEEWAAVSAKSRDEYDGLIKKVSASAPLQARTQASTQTRVFLHTDACAYTHINTNPPTCTLRVQTDSVVSVRTLRRAHIAHYHRRPHRLRRTRARAHTHTHTHARTHRCRLHSGLWTRTKRRRRPRILRRTTHSPSTTTRRGSDTSKTSSSDSSFSRTSTELSPTSNSSGWLWPHQ